MSAKTETLVGFVGLPGDVGDEHNSTDPVVSIGGISFRRISPEKSVIPKHPFSPRRSRRRGRGRFGP